MTYQEIIEKVREQVDNVKYFAWNDFDKKPFGKVEEVASHGGEEQGSDWWVVFYFVDHDVYVRIDGYYASYDGTSFDDGWDSCSEVRPKEKTITVYE